jgi:gliding motility-associated-like protein
MKKISFLLVFCVSAFFVSAQISIDDIKKVSGVKVYQQITANNKDTVFVVMINGITSSTDITYNGFGTVVNWYKYTNLVTPIKVGSLDPEVLNPEDATGYVLEVDGKRRAVWVIDYKNYLPLLKSVIPNAQSLDLCHNIDLSISTIVPDLIYKTLSGNSYKLTRRFALKFNTVQWISTTSQWDSKTVTDSLSLPLSSYTVTAPLCDTKFTLSGDEFAHDLGIDTISKESDIYTAMAVECHLTGLVTARNEINEMSKPENKSPISYSVPIDVEFMSNPNLHVTAGSSVPDYFIWTIYKDNQLIVTRTDMNHRYTFTDYGTYKVKIVSSNATCSYSDSITINAYDAAIQVPNVFTPNGDNLNEEFRVGYKSLLGFECWVYNRWGRKVFYWNDPQKGWDGKINGKNAPEGPYFYIIKATGFGLDPKTKHDPKIKSTITLKGDINLLRGGNK